MTAPITVHIVEDDPSMRASLARLVGDGGYQLALFASAEDFLAVATRELAGCVLLDLRLPGLSGLELQERLVERGCLLPVVFLTAHGELPAGVRAMKQGAVDFLEKPVPADTLFAAIAAAVARDAVARRNREDVADLTARVASLSQREREVWLRVVRGQLNKQIAYDLGIVERTVKLHRAAAMTKLGAASVADLVLAAERLGLIGGAE
jgi:FixJ family two-component response regulator